MSDTAIARVYLEEAAATTAVVREQMGEDPLLAKSEAYRLELMGRTGYSVGLEIGIAIAITDVAAARRLQDFLARVVQQGDPVALRARDRQVGNFLRVLDL